MGYLSTTTTARVTSKWVTCAPLVPLELQVDLVTFCEAFPGGLHRHVLCRRVHLTRACLTPVFDSCVWSASLLFERRVCLVAQRVWVGLFSHGREGVAMWAEATRMPSHVKHHQRFRAHDNFSVCLQRISKISSRRESIHLAEESYTSHPQLLLLRAQTENTSLPPSKDLPKGPDVLVISLSRRVPRS